MDARAGGLPHQQVHDSDVRAGWEQRTDRRRPGSTESGSLELPPPAGLTATAGAGHIRLGWEPVTGAAGYLIERASADGEAERILRPGGSDGAAVAGSPFADTGVADGTDYAYRVAAVAGAGRRPRAWSESVVGSTTARPPGVVRVGADAGPVTGQLDRVWRMMRAERLDAFNDELFGLGNEPSLAGSGPGRPQDYLREQAEPGRDSAIGAPFVLSDFLSAQGRLAALAHCVFSDVEELGSPAAPVPQRLRPAHRRQPAQTQVLGRAPGGAPRRRRVAHHA